MFTSMKVLIVLWLLTFEMVTVALVQILNDVVWISYSANTIEA